MKGSVKSMSRQPVKRKKISDLRKIGKEKLILLALAGILLIGSSYCESVGHDESVETTSENIGQSLEYEDTMKEEIKKMIESIDGISDVKVMVTFKSGREKILQEDSDSSTNENGDTSVKKTTVILNQNSGDYPYVIKEIYPKIEGVAITASGAQLSNKSAEIVNMVAALFDIPVHKISVIKNK